MCCIFTCCGWIIDLVQRLWTFTMSCCISSAVCCVMLTSSMSGIALGYNYSLAEYIDLKETNVSIYLKRGVFDDEIADDMEWRRSGHQPVAGHIADDNLRTGAPEDSDATMRSGRRLDDSVFEAEDQNKYEGSLMKLTARPGLHETTRTHVTDDLRMGEAISSFTDGSLDQLKAIQSLVDARRAMGAGGTTLSPMPTYNVNERNLAHFPMYGDPDAPGHRRMMQSGDPMKAHELHPERKAVPDQSIGAAVNWLVPQRPDKFNKEAMPEYFILSPTYPSPITLNLGPSRPQTTAVGGVPDEAVMFATRTIATTTKRPAKLANSMEKESPAFHENFLLESEQLGKPLINMGKTSEEEYEDEIKGLPVRKRRSIKEKVLSDNDKSSTKRYTTNIHMQNDSITLTRELNTQEINENGHGKTLLSRLISTIIEARRSTLSNEITQTANHVSAKKIKIPTRMSSFESKIVSSKYVTNSKPKRLFNTKQTTNSAQEILNSISINLNEAGLLINPSSSTFVKLLQSTLM